MTDGPANVPTSKADVISMIETAKTELDAVLAEYPEDELTRPGPEGWSAKDHVAHVASWEAGVVALLREEDRVAAMGITQEDWATGDDDHMNAVMRRRDAGLSLDEAIDRYRTTHEALLAELDRLTWEDLLRPYADYDPAVERDESKLVGYTVGGNTYGHYPEHAKWIRELIAANRAASGTG